MNLADRIRTPFLLFDKSTGLYIDRKIFMTPFAKVAISRAVTLGNDKPPAMSDPREHLVGSDCKKPKSESCDKNLMSSIMFAVLKWMCRFRKFLQ